MKNRNFLKNSIRLLLPSSLVLGALFGVSKGPVKKADAYTGASLPTTIKLNDPNESTIRNYYSDLDSLTEDERKGNNLLKNLKPILSENQKYYNYDSGDLVWKMYEITDRDWDKSPASSTTYGTYDASSNTIKNYQYGSNSTPKNNPYVRAYYMDRNQDNVVKAWGNHNQDATGINREHLWAKAEGFDGSGAAGARGDPMHLVAANGYANNIHSNHFYGYVDKTKSYTDVKNTHSTLGHNYSGYSKTYPSSSVTVFEPQDCDKGDIARAIFYMAARYNNIAGKSASQETFDADNPNLLLTNDLSKWQSSGYTSTATSPGYHGLISDLLEWNRIDKPDAYEIHRNNLLYTNFTNNRNPFIDFPEWADYIWGDQSSYAKPSSDTLNGGGGGTSTVTVTSLEITNKPTKLVYEAGDSLDLTGMVVKANKSDGTSQTLTSAQYTVTPKGALKISDTEVTVSYEGKSASFAIAVKGSGGGSQTQTSSIVIADYGAVSFETTDKSFKVLAKTDSGTDPAYNATGKDLRIYAGGTLTLTSNTGNISKIVFHISTQGLKRQPEITPSVGSMAYDMNNKVVTWTGDADEVVFTVGATATYGSEGSTKAGQFDFLSLDITYGGGASLIDIKSITLNKSSATLEIGQSDNLLATISPEDASIKLVSWSSSNSTIIEVSDEGEIVAKSAGTATITCSALDGSGVTATCTVTVNEPVTLQSLSLSGDYATEFYLNDEFSNTGMIVTANYSNGTHVDVSDEAECSGFDPTKTGTQTITVSYDGVSTTYTITVKETRLEENQRLFVASKQGVGNGEALTSYDDDPITLAFSKNTGSNPPKYYSSTQSFRVYGGNTFTLTGTKKITKVEFEMASGDTVGSNAITVNAGVFSSNTWTGNENTITFTVGGSSGHRNIVSLKVTFDENSQEIATISSISLSGTQKTEFFKNEIFTYEGLIVTAYYSDETEAVVTPTSVSTPSTGTTGTKTVTVTYTENGITKSATYEINVVAIVGTSIELVGNFKTEYTQGDVFTTSGMTVVEHKNNGTTENHLPSSCTITGYDMDTVGEQTVTVTFKGLSTSYTIHVLGTNLKTYVATVLPTDFSTASYSANNGKHEFVAVNANNSNDKRKINLTTNQIYQNSNVMQWQKNTAFIYNDEEFGMITSVVINSTEGTFYKTFGDEAIDSVQTANSVATTGKYFNVSVDGALGKTTSLVITFTVPDSGEENVIESISLSGDYKTSFEVGDEFVFGGTITAIYLDNSEEDITSLVTFTGYDMTQVGQQNVTVTYGDVTTTYSITVKERDLNAPITLDFDLTKNPGNWPTDNSNELKDYSYSLKGTNYTFSLSNVKCNSGYLMLTKTAILGLPAINGYKLTTIVASNSGGCSTSTNVGVSSSTDVADYVSGGEAIKWGTQGSTYRYELADTQSNTVYYLIATNANAQIVNLELTYTPFVEISANEYSLVTNVNELRTGDEIIFTAYRNTNKTAYTMSSEYGGHVTASSLTFDSEKMITNEESMSFIIERTGNNFRFRNSSGNYLCTTKKDTGGSGFESGTLTNKSLFNLSYENDVMNVVGVSENTDFKVLQFNYANGSPRFAFYQTATQTQVSIYKKTSQIYADSWAKSFLESTDHCNVSDWSALKSSYNNLQDIVKEEISGVEANASTDYSLRAQAMARYDYMLARGDIDQANNFISERGVAGHRPVLIGSILLENDNTLLIAIISLVGVSIIGGYFFVKRRKNEEL